jgi:hypothetical protein
MSRQYPSSCDIDYFIGWAQRKIIQMAEVDRVANFVNVAELTRSVAFYLAASESAISSSEQWLSWRISDTYYMLCEMQRREGCSDEFKEAEEGLIDILNYIVEYYEENGYISPSSLGEGLNSKIWRPPTRWLQSKSSDCDSLG